MNTDQRVKVIQIIEDILVHIDDEIRALELSTVPISPDNAIGRLSRMEAIGEKSVKEASLRLLKQRKIFLNNALKNKKSDQWGLCLECGEEISFKRMKARAESVRCMECLND